MTAKLTANGDRGGSVSSPHPCVRCGWCIDACEAGANPAGLLEAAQQVEPVLADRFGLALCDQCGDCESACPSKLPLVACIRSLVASLA